MLFQYVKAGCWTIVAAKKKSACFVITSMVMSIIASVSVWSQVGFAITSLIIDSFSTSSSAVVGSLSLIKRFSQMWILTLLFRPIARGNMLLVWICCTLQHYRFAWICQQSSGNEIRLSSVGSSVVCPSVSQLSLYIMSGFLSNFSYCFP